MGIYEAGAGFNCRCGVAGVGLKPVEHIEAVLQSRERRMAGPTLPAAGLSLNYVEVIAMLLLLGADGALGCTVRKRLELGDCQRAAQQFAMVFYTIVA